MKVIWQPSAKKGRTEVAAYIRRQFGAKRKISFLQEVRETTQMLRKVSGFKGHHSFHATSRIESRCTEYDFVFQTIHFCVLISKTLQIYEYISEKTKKKAQIF